MDDVCWGGERHGGSRGRGSENKIPYVAAVSTNEEGHPIAMSMTVVKGFRLTEISKWAQQHLQSGSLVVSDGLACFAAVKDAGCLHDSIVSGGGHQSVTKEEFTWVNTMTGNVKNAITGTYHAIKPLEKLSLVMRKIKGKSAKELNEFLGRKGTFWLKDYYDKELGMNGISG